MVCLLNKVCVCMHAPSQSNVPVARASSTFNSSKTFAFFEPVSLIELQASYEQFDAMVPGISIF